MKGITNVFRRFDGESRVWSIFNPFLSITRVSDDRQGCNGRNRIFKATLTKYVTLLNDKALDSGLELTIHSEDENLRLSIGAATKGRDIRSLFWRVLLNTRFWFIFSTTNSFSPSAGSRIGD